MKCPKCEHQSLEMPNEDDFELVCQDCGTAYELNEIGYYEEGGNELKQKEVKVDKNINKNILNYTKL